MSKYKIEDIHYVSAQPDDKYFHWQVEVIIKNFTDLRINPNNIHLIFSHNVEPSQELKNLCEKYPDVNIASYLREVTDNKGYIPILRPHSLAKYWKDNKFLENKIVVYHDSDVIFRCLPDWEKFLDDEVWYMSNTNSYINATYINSKSDQHIEKMAEIVGIDKQITWDNDNNSGGAQYFMKNVTAEFWEKVEKNCLEIYEYLSIFEDKERPTLTEEQLKSYNPLQRWCADMWSVLWNAWFFKNEIRVTETMDFSWATDPISRYYETNIFHCAGVVDQQKDKLFYKGQFISKSPFGVDFSYVDKDSASIKYVEAIQKVKQ